MAMKVSKGAMPPDKFRESAKRMSKYVDLRGCRTEKCINERIRRINSPKLNGLIKSGFASRLLLESCHNPHPVYKEILGMDDDVYDMWIEDKKKAEKRLKKLRKLL